jgi:hypothetical protein
VPTPQQIADDHAAYAAAYNDQPGQSAGASADAPAEGSPAEEAAESPAQESAEQSTGVDDTADAGNEAGQTPMEAQGDAGAPAADAAPRDAGDAPAVAEGSDAPTAGQDGQGQVDIAKETQRLKSWEGRLKAMEAQLKGPKNSDGETPVVEAIEEVADQANVKGDTGLSQAADKAADQVEQGTLTPEAAMKQLADDFGDDFVNLISVVAQHIASKAATDAATKHVAGVSKSVDDIVSHLSDAQARQHFKEIGAAHPDYDTVARSPEFKAFVLALPGDEKTKAEATLKGGSSDDINSLLSKFKSAASKDSPGDVGEADPASAAGEHKPAEPDPKTAARMAAAEGVRSKGAIKLPEQPAGDQSYEDAWKALS